MNWQKSREDTLAVDLGSDAIRVLEVRPGKNGPAVKFFATQQLAEGTPDTLCERHIAALKELLAIHRVKSKRIVASLPTAVVVTRAVQIDRAKSVTVEEQIRNAMENCLPFESADMIFDYWPTNPAQNGREEILVVATQGTLVQEYLDGFEKLRLSCVHIDVAPCAMATLLRRSEENAGAIIGSVVLSAGTGFFAIVENGKLLFWRLLDLSAGGKGVTIPGLSASIDRVGDEIAKCVSHMVGAMNVDALSEFVVYGNGSEDAVVNDYLKNRFHLPVSSPSPFDALSEDAMAAGMRKTVDHKTATHYHTAVGLALQCAGAPIQGANVNG